VLNDLTFLGSVPLSACRLVPAAHNAATWLGCSLWRPCHYVHILFYFHFIYTARNGQIEKHLATVNG